MAICEKQSSLTQAAEFFLPQAFQGEGITIPKGITRPRGGGAGGSQNLQPSGCLKPVCTHKSRKAVSHTDTTTGRCCKVRKGTPVSCAGPESASHRPKAARGDPGEGRSAGQGTATPSHEHRPRISNQTRPLTSFLPLHSEATGKVRNGIPIRRNGSWGKELPTWTPPPPTGIRVHPQQEPPFVTRSLCS